MKVACLSLLALLVMLKCALAADPTYLGATGAVVVSGPGCNTSSPAQIPGSADLFINRQLLTADGAIAGIGGPNDCSGGNRANKGNGKIYNRASLVLNKFNWNTHKFSIVKPLIDTSIDNETGLSRAIIRKGAMRGAIIRSAYDADIVIFQGNYLVAFECTLEKAMQYGVEGTSSCLSVYDPETQSIDFSRTKVVVSGHNAGKNRFVAAAVPHLLVHRGKLFIYWSALEFKNNKGQGIEVRGAQIISRNGDYRIVGSLGRPVRADDDRLTTIVWSPDPTDPLSDTSVNLTSIWNSRHGIIAAAAVGGSGCVNPAGAMQGCFRLSLATAEVPLGKNIFNQSKAVPGRRLPTNPQEYVRPVRDDDGNFWLYGHFVNPRDNGYSELRPVPGDGYWNHRRNQSVMIIFPLASQLEPVE